MKFIFVVTLVLLVHKKAFAFDYDGLFTTDSSDAAKVNDIDYGVFGFDEPTATVRQTTTERTTTTRRTTTRRTTIKTTEATEAVPDKTWEDPEVFFFLIFFF